MWRGKRTVLGVATMAAGLLLLAGCAGGGQAGTASTSGSGSAAGSGANASGAIVLSNSYIGNAWRQTMVSDVQAVASEAKKSGKSSGIKVVNSNNDIAQQISQLQSIILEKPKVILLEAASTTALNGVVEKACSAGIKVLAFDALVTAPCAYNMAPDWVAFGEQTMESVAKKMKGQGNLILVRGVAGTAIDQGMYAGWEATLKKYPRIKVVGTVYGQWDDATTQQAVAGLLTTAPKVDGVMAYVSGYGAVQAFVTAHRPVPIVYGSNQGTFLKWWAQEKKANGYSTESSMETPSISQAAYWVAVNMADGKDFDKTLVYPNYKVTDATVEAWAAKTPNDGFAEPRWTEAEALKQWPTK